MSNTILVVDDIAANRNLLGATLEPRGYEVLLASTGSAAVKVATRALPNLILMDVNMPEMDGYEACKMLKGAPETSQIPVIFITANDDPDSLIRGFQAGGVDFITKPFKEQEVLMRVETHIKIHSLKHALEERNREMMQKNSELQLEVRLRIQAEEKATQASDAKSRFLAFISHEMRSPLNAIIGFSEELVDALNPATQACSREDASRIRSAGNHLLGLINNLLDLSKIEAGKMPLCLDEVDLLSLVNELGKDLEPLVRRHSNSLSVSMEGVVGRVRVDPTRLRQVLTNLIGNAAKFTREGRIAILISPMEIDGVAQFTIEVSDTGIGMTSEQMGRLFTPYQQASDNTARQFGGTGLGLAISREFCRLMGGDLLVSSEAGRGSTFTVQLPQQVEAPADSGFATGTPSGKVDASSN